GSRPHVYGRLMQCRSAGGAGIFDVDYRDTFKAHRAKRHLSGHYDLTLEDVLTSVAEVRGLHVTQLGSSVGQRRIHRLPSEVLDRCVGAYAESRHAHPDDPHRGLAHDTDSSVSRASP